MRQLIFLFVVTVIIGIGCNSNTFEDQEENSGGRIYAPIEEGKYRTFHYDTIFYRGSSIDTFSGYFKYEIGEAFGLPNGETSNKLNISWKRNKASSFKLHRVETIRYDGDRLVVSDNGLNYIKLAFPLVDGKGWFGNKLFDTTDGLLEDVYGEAIQTIKLGSDWRYLPSSLDQPLALDSVTVDKGLIVTAIDFADNIEERFVQEYYGENIGMIGKKMKILLTQDGNLGYEYNLQLIDYN